ncbi:hypothetical protein D5S17_09420 [Pseudonocardiaceae bacterium YIM PH 21723]|nr:hypothetical protein D5S17_09420 [Pseudonocardiaceae bacterium YIM PH 21723]
MGGGDPGPGSTILAGLITQAGEELLADFQHHYRINLADLVDPAGGMSPRRALALIRQLPPESATHTVLAGTREARGWSTDRHLLAAVVDAVRESTWATIATHSKRRPAPPKPLPRPGMRQRSAGPSFRQIAAAHMKTAQQHRGDS